MDRDDRATMLARLLAGTRLALGLALFLAPARSARGWLGGVVDEPGASLAVRGLGARDVALGVGQLAALSDRGADVASWLEAGAVADAADAAAALLARDEITTLQRVGTLASAGSAAALALWLRGALTR